MPRVEPISYMTSPTRPTLLLPAGACDTHCHIFGPPEQFPFAADRLSVPHEAGKEKLFALHREMGIDRAVIVQSVAHGFDNTAVCDAIAASNGACLGIALLPTAVGRQELLRLDAAGFRGIRFNFIIGHLDEVDPIEDVIALSPKLAELGWHLQVQLDGDLFADMVPYLRRSTVPVVIDHMGRIDASQGLAQPAFRHLQALLDDGRFWVKLSGIERISRQRAPYPDAVPFARKLVAEHGDRVVWGTDWPHPGVPTGIPDDGILVDLLAEIAPSDQGRHALLVENPQRLYGFPPPPGRRHPFSGSGTFRKGAGNGG